MRSPAAARPEVIAVCRYRRTRSEPEAAAAEPDEAEVIDAEGPEGAEVAERAEVTEPEAVAEDPTAAEDAPGRGRGRGAARLSRGRERGRQMDYQG